MLDHMDFYEAEQERRSELRYLQHAIAVGGYTNSEISLMEDYYDSKYVTTKSESSKYAPTKSESEAERLARSNSMTQASIDYLKSMNDKAERNFPTMRLRE